MQNNNKTKTIKDASSQKMIKQFEPLWIAIETVLKNQETLIITIDGHSTSGKSTLADLIEEKYDAQIIHMDDFFRSKAQGESSIVYGSNIDFDRLKSEVIEPLAQRKNIIYRPFDCKTQTIMPSIIKACKKVTVIEGAYASHPYLTHHIDIKVFLKSRYLQQLRRIIKRNGFKGLKMFVKKWIPYERAYFKHYNIEEQSHFIFKSIH
ncbi:MAG: hypothetical protein K9L02_04315 [Acholeplasmataceae bacterium]|nr:hypothetical protein [Acholeplasmataceae bacterium]